MWLYVLILTIILPLDLYGCETWSITFKEERRLRACESRVLRRVFGPKRDEVTEEWITLPNVVLNPLKPNDLKKKRRTAPLTCRHFILYIYSTNIRNEYFKHAA